MRRNGGNRPRLQSSTASIYPSERSLIWNLLCDIRDTDCIIAKFTL